MANYEYRCNSCGDTKTVSAKMSEIPATVYCEKCYKVMVRLLSSVPALYKVGGFYSTDYKDKKE